MASQVKQFDEEKRASDLALADFDKAAAPINSAISSIHSQIYDIDCALEDLQLAEFRDSVSAGYVVLYATSEYWMGDTINKPEPKKYNSQTLELAHVLSVNLES